MSEPDPRKDPRFRPFRAAAFGVYIAVVSVFCVAIILSVTRSVFAMTPPRPPPSTELVLTFRECLDGADALWSQLESQHQGLTRSTGAHTADQGWMEFRTRWLQQLREREAHCALESHGNVQLKEVYGLLERVQDIYAVQASQYAGEAGGRVEALRRALAQARSNPAAGRLP